MPGALLAGLAAKCTAALAAAPPSLLAGPALPPPALYVHEMVAAQAARTPDATALVDVDGVLTYRELVAEASGNTCEDDRIHRKSLQQHSCRRRRRTERRSITTF